MVNRIKELLVKIDELTDYFYKDNQSKGYDGLSKIMPVITSIMSDFLHDIPTFNECGMSIPLDIVIAQLNNLIEAIKNKDTIKTADCLKYEITDSLSLYMEILVEVQNG